MKSKTLKILSVFLTVAIVLGTVSMANFAGIELPDIAGLFSVKADAAIKSGKFTYTVHNLEATITGVDSSVSGKVEIPLSIDNYSVLSIGKMHSAIAVISQA